MAQYVRFDQDNVPRWGLVDGATVQPLRGDLFHQAVPDGAPVRLQGLRLLPPATPRTLVAVALNYRSHLGDRPVPAKPELFLKPLSCLAGPEEAILLPRGGDPVEAEGEVVAVIGRRARRAPRAQALGYVFGYTAGNDVSARHWQRDDLQWWRAKGADTFGVVGPMLITDVDPRALRLETRINGRTVQEGRLADLIFDLESIIAFVSAAVTLEPGDVIFTGTPGTAGRIQPGDVVEVEVSGAGVLRNPVRAEDGA